MIEHATVAMTSPDGRDVDIDVGIADLVEQVWALRCRTVWSCQNHGEAMAIDTWRTGYLAELRRWHLGYAALSFATSDDMTRFLTTVARGGPRDDFYLRMVHSMAPDAWRTSAVPFDAAIYADEAGGPPEAANFAVRHGLVFLPVRDVDEAADRVCRYLDGYIAPPVSIDWDRVGW